MKAKKYLILTGLLLVGCEAGGVSSSQTSNISSSTSVTTSEVSSTSVTTSGVSSSEEAEKTNIYVVGDSTACSFTDDYYYPRYGYATQLSNYLKEDTNVINLALSGRSSKSFLTETNYQTLKSSIKSGDYLLISFGHNDEKTEADRYTNPNTDVNTDGSFKKSLFDNYVKIAQDIGATPILTTPIVRRSSSNTYEGNNIHITTGNDSYPGGDYSKAIRELGTEKGVDVVDLTTLTKDLWSASGATETLKYHAWIQNDESSVDNTHLNLYGANIVSYLLTNSLKSSSSTFKNLILDEIAMPSEATYRVPNPNYVEPTYTSPTASGTTFASTAPWWTSVFGDVGGASKINTTNFGIAETANGVDMRAGVWNDSTNSASSSSGKISGSAGDGIAMYFQQIASDRDFTFSVDAKVLTYDTNNQVGFGLMLRDDMYIDSFLGTTITGDYMAAGSTNFVKGATAVFSKESGKLSSDVLATAAAAFNDTIHLEISRTGDTVTCKYGEQSFTYQDTNISRIDASYDYVGLFVSRNAHVEYSNISFN